MYRAVCGWGVRTAMAVSLLCGVAVSGSQSAAADTGDGAVPAGRSGLAWASGAFIPGDNVARHTEFGNWRGAPTDVVVTWTGRWVWSDIVSPHWLLDRWSDSRQLISIGVPPFPEGEWGSLSRCASGEYDHHWRTFGRSMRDSGMAHRTVIRLGWEFTGFWYRWAARNPWEFAACWRRVHSAAESEAPGLRWDWTVHRGRSPLGIDPRDAYPGDAYVDVVGVNSYDGWPGATDRNTWREHYAGDYGLKFWADFRLLPQAGRHPRLRVVLQRDGVLLRRGLVPEPRGRGRVPAADPCGARRNDHRNPRRGRVTSSGGAAR
jgi:hypothetical protein